MLAVWGSRTADGGLATAAAVGGVSGAVLVPAFGHVQSPIQRRGGRIGGGVHADRDLQLKPVPFRGRRVAQMLNL